MEVYLRFKRQGGYKGSDKGSVIVWIQEMDDEETFSF